MGINLDQLPPKVREQVAQKMLRENKEKTTPPSGRRPDTSTYTGEVLDAGKNSKRKQK